MRSDLSYSTNCVYSKPRKSVRRRWSQNTKKIIKYSCITSSPPPGVEGEKCMKRCDEYSCVLCAPVTFQRRSILKKKVNEENDTKSFSYWRPKFTFSILGILFSHRKSCSEHTAHWHIHNDNNSQSNVQIERWYSRAPPNNNKKRDSQRVHTANPMHYLWL